MKEVADNWANLSAETQQKALEKMFGKTRANVGAAIIGNIKNYDKTMATLSDPKTLKSADKELGVASESIEFKLNALKETWTGVTQNLFQSDQIKVLIDGFTSLSHVIEMITEKIGLLGTVFGGIALFKAGKGIA